MTPQLLQRPPKRDRQKHEKQQDAPQTSGRQIPDNGPTIEITEGRELSLPQNASPAEAAAIAAAVSAHLSAHDAARSRQQTPDYVSNWTLARRLGAGRNARHLPRAKAGDAWKLSSRLHC